MFRKIVVGAAAVMTVAAMGFVFVTGQISAAEPASLEREAAKTYKETKTTVHVMLQEAAERTKHAQKLLADLPRAQGDKPAVAKIADQLEADAEFFENFAQRSAEAHGTITAGVQSLNGTGSKIDAHAQEVDSTVQAYQTKASEAKYSEEKAGYLRAARFEQDKARRWKALSALNSTLKDGLSAQDARVERFIRIIAANAAVYRSAAGNVRLSADIQTGSNAFEGIDDAEIDSLLQQVTSSWTALDGVVSEMGSEADKLMELAKATKLSAK